MTDEPDMLDDTGTEPRERDLGVVLDPGDERADPERYPAMWNASAGLLFKAVLRAQNPEPPEYVTVPLPAWSAEPRLEVAISEWNMMWEAAQFRRRIAGAGGDLPPELERVADRGDINVVFVPRTRTRYHEYSPLFHLLPRRTVERHGLPMRARGQWPFLADWVSPDLYLPTDFADRLSRAWAGTVWRHLMPASPMWGFASADPIRLLAHNLDFWIPPVTQVMEDVLREFPIVENGAPIGPAVLEDGSMLMGATVENPRCGGELWAGEEEADEVTRRTVEVADADGRLRGILDAVRSNRVEDDFTSYWTRAREDFERKLYNKRAKVKVRFVELTDTILVQGPETEVIDRTVYGDFLTLLNERDREIVVLLHSGMTKLTEVGETLGYSNHSAVSKRLNRIRAQAANYFDLE
ncbi:sigma-70 family RNA polymerase sigma factor [Rhodococcus sp. NPDC058505]|uniref:sigma-70 family RNA polymerase sigma factor n=1 Tax=unclassified Rhodococcus (in: high G+C Gram-positive bacteria) TaxID=192944 RepID=UPI00365748E3